MRPTRELLLALGLAGLVACPNPASSPAPRPAPPPVTEDRPETAAARSLERLLGSEARGRLPKNQRPVLRAALVVRAGEWLALGAPSAALADLRHAEALGSGARPGGYVTLMARILRALGDRALARGERDRARRLYRDATGLAPLGAWRRAVLEPGAAALEELGEAVRRLHKESPELARQLLGTYLDRGGRAPEVLLAGLAATREHPDRTLERRVTGAIVGLGSPDARARACALVGAEALQPGCAGLAPDPCAAFPPPGAILPLELERARGATRAQVERTHGILGAILRRWGLDLPPPDAPWPLPLPPGIAATRSWALVARGHHASARTEDPTFLAVFEAMRGRLAEAERMVARAGPGLGPRLLARFQALSGRRRAAARTLLGLREQSPGGTTWLLTSLEDLGVLGLVEAALGLAVPLVEAGHDDPVVLRVLVGLFVALGEGDRATLLAERWAAADPDPARAYRFAMRRFAEIGDAPRTSGFAAKVLEWTGGARGSTRKVVTEALHLVGRHAEADALGRAEAKRPEAGPAPRGPAAPPRAIPADALGATRAACAPGAPGARTDAALVRLALGVAVAPPGRGAALSYCAASVASGAGQGDRGPRILADAWLRDPERFGAAGTRRLGLASRGRPLWTLLPWDRILHERRCPW